MDNSRNTGITIHYHEYFEFGIKTVLQNCPFGYVANLNAAVIFSESASLHRYILIMAFKQDKQDQMQPLFSKNIVDGV